VLLLLNSQQMKSLLSSHLAAPGLHSSSRQRANRQHAPPHTLLSKQLLGNSWPSPAVNQPQQQQQQRLQPVAVSYADAPSQAPQAGNAQPAAAAAAAAVVKSPKHNPLQEPVSWGQAGHGLSLFTDGSSCFRVWAPHATSAVLQVRRCGCGLLLLLLLLLGLLTVTNPD
jgi:hypothetical protein